MVVCPKLSAYKELRWISTFFQIIGIVKVGELSMSILIIYWPILLIGDYIRKVFLSFFDYFLPFYYIGIVLFFCSPCKLFIKTLKIEIIIGL